MPSPSLTGRDDEDRSLRELSVPTHTPGPWSPQFGGEEITVEGYGNPSGTIAVLAGRQSVTTNANARLIAAAPDMYAELARELSWLQHIKPQLGIVDSVSLGIDQAIKAIGAVLAKADGRS